MSNLIHSEDKPAITFRNPYFYITGIQRFCSGALLYGIEAWGEKPDYGIANNKRYVRSNSFEMYKKTWVNSPQCRLDLHGAYCYILEGVYQKAKFGEGGEDMYASQHYATKTWFIADRDRKRYESDNPNCLGFMRWLKNLGRTTVGTIHISPWQPGAHGGRCKGAVWAPNLPAIKDYLDEQLARYNAHAKEMCESNYIDPAKINPKDEVAALW